VSKQPTTEKILEMTTEIVSSQARGEMKMTAQGLADSVCRVAEALRKAADADEAGKTSDDA